VCFPKLDDIIWVKNLLLLLGRVQIGLS
jgi:hypothetical protein